MLRLLKNRNNQIMLAFILLMTVLLIRLFVLTVIQGEVWRERASDLTTKTLYTAAPRGRILDRNGVVLADNVSTFNLTLNRSGLSSATLNRIIGALIDILERNQDIHIDDFPILLEGPNSFAFTYDGDIGNWLLSQDMPDHFTAQQAFDELRRRYGVSSSLDVYDAQLELQNRYGVYPPISVRYMEFTPTLEKSTFLGRYDLSSDITASEAFRSIRARFQIDPGLAEEDIRSIMIFRNALDASGYYSYIPVTVASNVSYGTVIEVKERSSEFPGVDIVAESVRSYPFGETAGHVIGYMGTIADSEKEFYLDQGYNTADLVGKTGIESVYESQLRGTDGMKVVQVNSLGESISTVSDTQASKGHDVALTIDLELQQTAESALQGVLNALSEGGTFQSAWGNVTFPQYVNANVGAAVVLDVKSGDVLAMANVPSFDPNLFAAGINSADWNAFQAENPRDPLSPAPLFNVAARTAVQPGSAFKMVVAAAALANGLDADKRYRDDGAIVVGDRTFGCLVWNESRQTHGYLNLVEALEVSCNYYFYNLISNYDHALNVSMGMDPAMSADAVTEYALQFGLGVPTGIEIPEAVGTIPSSEQKMVATIAALRRLLRARSEWYFDTDVIEDSERLERTIEEIAAWCSDNPSRNQILMRLATMGIKKERLSDLTDLVKYSYFNQAQWNKGDLLNMAIGQGGNAYTPLQMANYTATLANGGARNQVNLVRSVDGGAVIEKTAPEYVDASPEVFETILEGMRRVAHEPGGSASPYFSNFPVTVAAKTGSAEKSGKINPPDEGVYLRENLYRIAPGLVWTDVQERADVLMRSNPVVFSSVNEAMRSAVVQLSDYAIGPEDLDAYKEDYDNFSWFVCCAPADDPQIAVAILLVQGGQGSFGAPVAREILAKYFALDTP
jgi:penicillin-binding protein 2